MKITIDALPLMSEKTGIGYYTHHLLSEFVKIAPDNDYYLCDVLGKQGFYNMVRLKKNPSNDDDFFRMAKVPFPFMTLARLLLMLQKKLTFHATKIEESDVFLGTNFRGIFKDSFKTVLTIHDMAYAYFPEATEQESLKYLQQELPSAAEKAHAIITVSESTKRDVVRFLHISPEKIAVVHLGVAESFRPLSDHAPLKAVRERYRLPHAFILSVGTIQPRKNLTGLLEAYALLRADDGFRADLVIAGGKGWKSERLKDHIKSLGLEGRVHFTGYVDENDLPALYNLAEVFVFPSFYEGFGLPLLEAMACGVPVVASNNSSIPEIAGDAAVLVDPHSPESIAHGIKQAINEPDLRRGCIERGIARSRLFTWEKCARETLAVLRTVTEKS